MDNGINASIRVRHVGLVRVNDIECILLLIVIDVNHNNDINNNDDNNSECSKNQFVTLSTVKSDYFGAWIASRPFLWRRGI